MTMESKVPAMGPATQPFLCMTPRYLAKRPLSSGSNVERDPDAAKDIVRKTGQAGVPVIICAIWIADKQMGDFK